MPPKGWRKQTDGQKAPAGSANTNPERGTYGLDELLLPRQTIAGLARTVLPGKTALPKDGVTALQRSSTVFISYIASYAYQNAQLAGRKTVTPADVHAALERAHFGQFVAPVQELTEKLQKKPESSQEPEQDQEMDVESDQV